MNNLIVTNLTVVSECITELNNLYEEIQLLTFDDKKMTSSGKTALEIENIILALEKAKDEMAQMIKLSHDFAKQSYDNQLSADRSSKAIH